MAHHTHAGTVKHFDASSFLTLYICLLLGIPSTMVVGPLGSAGAPSTILAIAMLFMWAWFQIHRDRPLFGFAGFQSVRAAMLGWLIIMLIVYAHAMSSPIPSDEVSPADSGLLKLVGWAGVVLVANDGIPSLERHRAVLRRLVIGVGIIAAFGLFQAATKQLWIDSLRIPGLTAGTADWSLAGRNGLARPSGTSTHPIEYGVVLTMVLPLVIVYALKAPTRRWLYRAVLCVVTFAVFLSISRSALLCAAVGFVVMATSWSVAARVRALLFTAAIAVVVYVTVPGVLGTITGLFTGASEDPSVASRTSSYDLAGQFISTSPLLGRGFGTFLPKYWILDNNYLGLLIEGGILALAGLLALIVTAAFAARRARRLAVNEFDRDLAQALVASIAAGACGLGFFDTLAFPQSAGTFFLLVGMAGAALRLTRAETYADRFQPVGEQPDFLPYRKSEEKLTKKPRRPRARLPRKV